MLGADRRQLHNPLIVALDVSERDRIVQLARVLAPHVGMVKLGLQGFVAHGPDLVRQLRDLGVEVFLDLKLHDIPRTVAAAAREASALGICMLTVHAAGGSEMVAAARQAVDEATQIIAVTVLTSLDDALVREVGFSAPVAATVRQLGALALTSGADGLVCSAHELAQLAELGGVRVVPGVRPAGAAAGDQRRVATPEAALAAGANWLVVGRPIVQAPDPVAAAQAIAASLGAGEQPA